jgi:membrane protein YqaA with SNARE-associated domain
MLALRTLLGLALLLGIVVGLATHFKPELESLARGFVQRFGLPGMAFGTFLADGLHFPVPPQFYMLMGIAGGTDTVAMLATISVGSLLGGVVAYGIAGRLGRLPRVAAWLARTSRIATGLFERYGYYAPLVASATPVAYSVLCYLAGACRLPWRLFAALSLLRIPKLIAYFYLIRLGWSLD